VQAELFRRLERTEAEQRQPKTSWMVSFLAAGHEMHCGERELRGTQNLTSPAKERPSASIAMSA
jgi:hypothetical protein